MHTEMVIQNPLASGKLRYGLDVVCNVDDEIILLNCLTNACKVKNWVKSAPPNDKTLLICGSGPSIRDDVSLIQQMQEDGCEVWALNNCANFLATFDILPDAQVIMDAQMETIRAIGPAKSHLFASQVHPSLFDAVPNAILWHSTHGNVKVDEQEGFPDHDDGYCLVGSAVSVGNTALVLAFAMGYRNIHLFGYDSSNKGVSHVIHQPWNDGEPMTIVEFAGKQYVSSLTMSLQAQAFPSRASVLIREGCNITVHGYGLLPDRWNSELTEQQKYEEVWKIPGYRDVSPGELIAEKFIEIVQPNGGSRIADFGCGTGRGSLAISKLGKFQHVLLDFADNSRDEEARHFPFMHCDISGEQKIPVLVDHGYCTDVLEHIPPELVERTLTNIMGACSDCFFQISTVPDEFGGSIGRPLHLTVEPYSWWLDKFHALGFRVLWQEEGDKVALFHISSTGDSK